MSSELTNQSSEVSLQTLSEVSLQTLNQLLPHVSYLREEDQKDLVELGDELRDTWEKHQIYRTETEIRVSVLNDGRHPTYASKYWQCIREMEANYSALTISAFALRRNEVKRLKLEKALEEAIQDGDQLEQMDIQINLDECLLERINLQHTAHDRVRELKIFSKIKSELDDGSFDTKNPNTHQAKSLQLFFENKVRSLTEHSSHSDILNSIGPLSSMKRLNKDSKEILPFNEVKQLNKDNTK